MKLMIIAMIVALLLITKTMEKEILEIVKQILGEVQKLRDEVADVYRQGQ